MKSGPDCVEVVGLIAAPPGVNAPAAIEGVDIAGAPVDVVGAEGLPSSPCHSVIGALGSILGTHNVLPAPAGIP